MPFFLLLLGVAFYVAWSERQAHAGHAPPPRRLPPAPRPPGMPPPGYWPAPAPGPESLPPAGPSAPAVAAPPSCAGQWHLPQHYSDIPHEVVERAKQIQASAAPHGTELVERWAGGVWHFQVETHGANDQNPKPHRGVGVRLCV